MCRKFNVLVGLPSGLAVRHLGEVDPHHLAQVDEWQAFEEIAQSMGGVLLYHERAED